MTYETYINNIIQTRGRFGCKQNYHERHHIIPKCKNGNDEEDNLVDLFAEEHFIAHKLLAEENPDDSQLQYAYLLMAFVDGHDGNRYELSPSEYADARKKCSAVFSGSNNPSARKVIRLCDGKIFPTVKECRINNNLSNNTLWRMLKLKKEYAYFDEWIVLTEKQKHEIINTDWVLLEHINRSNACNNRGKNNPRARPVYCPELNESFWGAKEAQDKYNISSAKIRCAASGKTKSAGKHPITGQKLTWKYLEK